MYLVPDSTLAPACQILLAVVATNGYERATIQLIAKQAGLAPGLVHYPFKDKRESAPKRTFRACPPY